MNQLFTKAAIFTFGLLETGVAGATINTPPNVLFILVDDLGWSDLSCYGNPYYKTPNIDAMASKGVRFTNAYSACTVSSPSRAAILTGKSPAALQFTGHITRTGKHRFPDKGRIIPPDDKMYIAKEEVVIAELFQARGYRTASIGKWHVANREDLFPEFQGFDTNIAGYMHGSPPSYFYPYRNDTPGNEWNSHITSLKGGKEGEYLTDRLTDEALSFMRESKKAEKPFFIYLSHYAVHTPLQAPAKLVKKYKQIIGPDSVSYNPVYAAMIENLDDNVGKLLNWIEESGEKNNTIVVFYSDNGGEMEATSNAPLKAGKGYLYEGGLRVPLIIQTPEVKDPKICHEVVTGVDMYPTLVELTHGTFPDSVRLNGVSLKDVILNDKRIDRPYICWYYPHYSPQAQRPGAAIRKGKFKLIENYDPLYTELYNIETDPSELHNLTDVIPGKTQELLTDLHEWIRNEKPVMHTLNPGYESKVKLLQIGLPKLSVQNCIGTGITNYTGGSVVAHSPKITGLYIGSPSICILPDGTYVASHDYFGPSSQNTISGVTTLYQSRDKGATWKKIAQLNNQYWSVLFHHQSNLYIMGTSRKAGDVTIRQSSDGGFSWTEAKDNTSGLLTQGVPFHCAPTPVIVHNCRIWRAVEDELGPENKWGKMFRTRMMSAPVDADLLKAESWTLTNPLPYDSTFLEGKFGGWLEGNAVLMPSGALVNVLRVDYRVGDTEKAAIVNISADGKTAGFDPSTGFIDFPGGCKKFVIRYDAVSGLFWTLSNYVPDNFKGGNVERIRNTLALSCSEDLLHWNVKKIILHHPDVTKHGFQYPDWQFEGNDIIAVSRTAFEDECGGADNQHNSNFITFHRIKNFRITQ